MAAAAEGYNPFAESDESDDDGEPRGGEAGRGDEEEEDDDDDEGHVSSIEVLEVPLLSQRDRDGLSESAATEGGDLGRKPWCSRKRVAICGLACCVPLVAVLCFAAFVGVKLFGVYQKCNSDEGCVKLQTVNLYQTGSVAPEISLPFNIQAAIDVPAASWASVFVDRVQVEVRHNESLLFTTSSLTPVFTDADGNVQESWLALGKSTVHLTSHSLLHIDNEDSLAAERVSRAAWLVLNQMGLDLQVRVRAKVGINLLFIPFRTSLDEHVVFHMEAANSSALRTGAGKSNFQMDLSSVDVRPTQNPQTDLSLLSTVTVSVDDALPEMVVNVSGSDLGRVDVYASNASFVPVLSNVIGNPAIGLVAESSVDSFKAGRHFSFSASAFSSSKNMSLSTMQRAARDYVATRDGRPTYVYLKTNADHQAADTSFLARVLDRLDPVRVELPPMGSSADKQESFMATATNRPSLLKEVEVERVTSTQATGQIDLRASLTANITGEIPEVVLDVISLGARTIEVVVPNGTIYDPRRGVTVLVRFQEPATLWDQLLAADYSPAKLALTLVGTARTDVSLVSSIFRYVSYSLTEIPSSIVKGSSLAQDAAKPKPRHDPSAPANHVDIYARSDPTQVAAGGRLDLAALNSSLLFRFRWAPRCVGGKPVVVSNARHQVRMELTVAAMEVGPGTQNAIQVDYMWKDNNVGAGFDALVRDIRAHANTSMHVSKDNCIDVTLVALHRLFSARRSAVALLGQDHDSTTTFKASAQFAALQSQGPRGASLDFGCVSAGTACDPEGAGLVATISPVEVAIANTDTRIRVRELPALRLLPVPGATLDLSKPEMSVFQSTGVHVSTTVTFEASTSEALRNTVQADSLAKSFRGDSSFNLLSAAVGSVTAAILEAATGADGETDGDDLDPGAAEDNVFAEDVSLDVFSGPDHVKVRIDCTPAPGEPGQLRLDVPALDIVLGDVGALRTSAWVFANTGLVSNFQADYQVDAKTAPAVTKLIGAVVNKQSSQVHVWSVDKSINVQVNLTAVSTRDRAPSEYSLEILGGKKSSEGERALEINVPCVLPNLCPKQPKTLNGEPYTLELDMLGSLAIDAQFFRRLQLRAPPVAFALNAGIHNRMLDFAVPAVDLKLDTKESHKVSIEFTVTLSDVQLLRDSIQTLMDSVNPISFRLLVPQASEQSMLPALLREADVTINFEAESPDGRPVPTPKEKQWWFPLASTGAWKLIYTTAKVASFEVNMLLHNPSPITVLLPTMSCEVAYLVGGPETPAPREALYFGYGYVNAGDLVLPGNESSRILSTLVAKPALDKKGDPPASCSPASVSDPTTRHNCVISTLLEKMVGKTETHILVSAGFVNPEGKRVKVNFESVFLEGETGKAIRPYVPPPRFAKDLPTGANTSAIDEFVGVFHTVNVDGWSTAWQSLIEQGVDLAVQVVLHNPFAFPIRVDSYALDLTFDDPTGEYVYYLPSYYPPQLGIPLVTNLSTSNLDMVIPGNATMPTPEVTVRLLDHRTELACRLYNAAEKVQQLCASVPGGIFKVGVGSFVWTQELSIYNVTAVGSNACLFEPACVPALLPAPDPLAAQWSLRGTASMPKAGSLLLTKGETDEVAAAWLQERVRVGDGFDISFDFELMDTSTIGGGDGIAFVVQRDGGPQALGQRCSNSPCNGYTSIPGPSFAVVLYRSTTEHVELHVLVNGQSKPEVGFASSPVLPTVADGKSHKLRVFYSRGDRKVYVYLDGQWQLSASVWEPALVDQGQCSAGGAKAQKSACIDMDGIARDDGRAWVGFTASTGIIMSSVQRIHNVEVSNILASLEQSVILENGLVIGEVKRKVKATVDLRDSCGAPIRRALSKTPDILIEDPHGGRFAPYDVAADPQGLIHLRVVPQVSGTFRVLARYGGDSSASFVSLGAFLVAAAEAVVPAS